MQTVLNKKLYYMYFISAESVEMQRKWNDFKIFNENIYYLIKYTLDVYYRHELLNVHFKNGNCKNISGRGKAMFWIFTSFIILC